MRIGTSSNGFDLFSRCAQAKTRETSFTGTAMNESISKTVDLDGKRIIYRLVRSKRARKLRIKVGLNGVEVIQPSRSNLRQVQDFLKLHEKWITSQLDRIERFRSLRKPVLTGKGEILYRGVNTKVDVEQTSNAEHAKVVCRNGCLTVICGRHSAATPSRILENWLREQARKEIHYCVSALTPKIGQSPRKIYIKDQKTKWGSCSSLQNLSFNWRLIMAPDFVLQYLVAHEVVHLKIMNHSGLFRETVKSLCPGYEKASQWLSDHHDTLMIDLDEVCRPDENEIKLQDLLQEQFEFF
jgi:predicted metal-dependent hydrolase